MLGICHEALDSQCSSMSIKYFFSHYEKYLYQYGPLATKFSICNYLDIGSAYRQDLEGYSLNQSCNNCCWVSMSTREKQSSTHSQALEPGKCAVWMCKVFTLLSRFSLITIELEPDILYIEGVLNDSCDVL